MTSSIELSSDKDLARLIRALSLPKHVRVALRVRNILLAPLIEQGVDSNDSEACWKAFLKHHGEKTVIKTYGKLPKHEMDDPSQDEAPLWAVVIISSGKRIINGAPALDLYISHEAILQSSSLEGMVPPPTKESAELLTRMYRETILPAMQAWNKTQLLYFGINKCWQQIIDDLSSKVLYHGNCTRLFKRLTSEDATRSISVPKGYLLRKATAEDCEKILSESGHPRPLEYYQSRIHFSSVVELTETHEIVAWALTHDDMSIGSLHTMEEHRKLGLGKIIIADLCRQFASRYPKYPLHKGDVLIHGDCEAYNDSAVAFFTKQGFGEVLYVSWTGVDI